MRLEPGWSERFYRDFERARLRELARLSAVDVDPFQLGALATMVQRIVLNSKGLTTSQRLALEQQLLDAADEIGHRSD